MAINKNFVIKNGVQVSTDLIIGDADNNKVGIGTTIPGYDLHVARGRKSRGGIGATDLVVTGVSTIKDLLVTGFSGFSSDVSVTGIVSARSFGIGTTEVIDRGLRLSGIASLDAITINTIEQAIRVGPNSFTDLKVTGISTFIGIATFSTGIDIKSGVSTFSAPLRLGFAHTTDHAGVALGATVGFGTSAFFRDDAAIFMGSDSDLKIHHDGSNSRIQDVGTGDLIIQGSADIKLQSASEENYIVANDTGSVDVYFDNSKKLETTSGGLKVTGITTLTDRLHVEAGISTFDADVRFGIGATVGFGTSAFFRDDAAIFLGNDSDLKIHHDGSNSRIQDVGTGDLILQGSADIKLQSASAENYIVANDTGSVEQYFDNSKKTETTSGGFKVTGITTLTDRLHVEAGISTFDADVRFGIGATVGFGTSAFFKDDAAIFLGDDSDLKIHHDGSNSRIQDVGTGDLILQGSADIKLQSASAENYIVANDTGSVEIYYDNSKKLESTSGGLSVTGITTFSDRINVVSGVSTFQDNAKLTFGTQGDLVVYHSGSHSFISDTTGTGNLVIQSNRIDIQNAAGDEDIARFNENEDVQLYYDDGLVFQTTPQGINVVGVTTSKRLNISGVSTFTSIGSNLIPDTDGSRNIGAAGSEWQDLHIDGTANIDTLDVDATSNFADDVTLVAAGSSTILFDASAHQVVFQDNIRAKFGTGSDLSVYHNGANSFIDNTTGVLFLRSDSNIIFEDTSSGHNFIKANNNGTTSNVELYQNNNIKLETTSGGLNVTGITTISDRLQVTSGISTFYDTTQSTSATTGAVVLDGGLGVAKNVNIGGNLTVTGTTTFNGGTITLGDADTDNVVFSADVDSSITPDDDDTYDLGSGTKEWKDLFIDGIAHLDNVDAGIATVGRLNVSGVSTFTSSANFNGLIDANGGAHIDNLRLGVDADNDITTSSGNLTLDSSGGTVEVNDNLQVDGQTDLNGDINLGNATSDTITVTGRFDSSLLPSGDTQDLGSASQEWDGLFIDGSAHIDVLDVDETAFVTETLTVGTGVTIQRHGGVSIAGITTIGGALGVAGNVTITNTAPALVLTDTDHDSDFNIQASGGILAFNDATNSATRLQINSDGDVKVGSGVTFQQNGNVAIAGITTIGGDVTLTGTTPTITFTDTDNNPDFTIKNDNGGLRFRDETNSASRMLINSDGHVDILANLDATQGIDITGAVTQGSGDITLTATVGSGSSTIVFDTSAGTLTFQDNIRLNIGSSSDLSIYHNGTDSYIQEQGTGNLKLVTPASGVITIEEADANLALFTADSGVKLYDGSNNIRVTTTTDGVDIGGTGSIRVPNGTTGERNSSPAAGDFRYNTTTGKFEGYTDEWGDIGGGSVEEVDTSVSTTSATSCGSFAIASFRSAVIVAQITQGSNYQMGRYLVIHDGTNVTTVEESAVATGSMLGTFEGVINGSNLEFRVTMGSSSSATVTTKIDTVTV